MHKLHAMKLVYTLLAIVFLTTSCGEKPTENTVETPKIRAIDQAFDWMQGSFSSAEQAKADSNYFVINLHMTPIFTQSADTKWLYVEQAVAAMPHKPYRQRVYRLTQITENQLESAVFTLDTPSKYTGAWMLDSVKNLLTPSAIEEKIGCSVFLTFNDSNFVGETQGTECSSALSGASYAVSQVTISPNGITSWDRGYDSTNVQVWGAETGGYIFKPMQGHAH